MYRVRKINLIINKELRKSCRLQKNPKSKIPRKTPRRGVRLKWYKQRKLRSSKKLKRNTKKQLI